MPRSRAPVRLPYWRVRVLAGTWGTERTRADTETLYWCLEETQGLAAAGHLASVPQFPLCTWWGESMCPWVFESWQGPPTHGLLWSAPPVPGGMPSEAGQLRAPRASLLVQACLLA